MNKIEETMEACKHLVEEGIHPDDLLDIIFEKDEVKRRILIWKSLARE